MATPRKAWFRVSDKVLYSGMSNDELAMLVRLMAYLNVRWAREGRPRSEAGKATLDRAAAMLVSGKHRADIAAKSLEHLANINEMFCEIRGDVVDISWDKYPIYQQYPPDPDPENAPSASASASAPASAKERESTVPPAPPASPATPASKSNGKSRRILIPKPDLFPGDSMDRLRAWGDKHGFGQRVLNAGLEFFREWAPVKPPYLRPIETWEGAFKKITRDGVADGKIKLTGDAAKPKGLAYAEWTGHGDEVAR